MKYQILIDEEIVGETDLEWRDDSMNVRGGAFVPTKAYKQHQPTFRMFATASEADDEALLKKYYQSRDALNFAIRSKDGEVVEGIVQIDDFEDEDLEIQILPLP